MLFSDEGGEGATPYEVLLDAAMNGESTRFTRQDGVEETWRIMQPLLDAPPPVQPYAPGSWGPPAADASSRARSLARAVDRTSDGAPRRGSEATTARARRRRRRSPRSPTTRSCPTATPARSWRPTVRSTGSACRASTRRACSARCSIARRASSASVRSASTTRPRARTSRERTCSSPRGGSRPVGWSCATRSRSARGTTKTRSLRTRARPRTTTASTHSCVPSSASRVGSRWSSSASRPSTTAGSPPSGRSSTVTVTPPTRPARA